MHGILPAVFPVKPTAPADAITAGAGLNHATRLPEYVCAIIRDQRGGYLLELRPPQAKHAANRLTCFGGKREAGESIHATFYRELLEEVGYAPAPQATVCALTAGQRWIASFIAATWPMDRRPRTLPGTVAIWAPITAFAGLPLSPWHRAVLAAIAVGRSQVDVAAIDDAG